MVAAPRSASRTAKPPPRSGKAEVPPKKKEPISDAEVQAWIEAAMMVGAESSPSELAAFSTVLKDLPEADAEWVRSSGWTPLEFLTRTYRNPHVRIGERISAAKAVLDYAHRKLPQALQLTGQDGAPLNLTVGQFSLTPERIASLTDEEIDTFRAVLEKLGAPVPGV